MFKVTKLLSKSATPSARPLSSNRFYAKGTSDNMPSTRWGDVAPLSDFMDDLGKPFSLFDNYFPQTKSMFSEWKPKADIITAPNEYQIHAELPGVSKDNAKITVDGDTLTISGERKDESEKSDKNYSRKERSYGKFTRSWTLPEEIDPKNIKAHFKDGVLEMSIPRKGGAQKAEPIDIPIEDTQAGQQAQNTTISS